MKKIFLVILVAILITLVACTTKADYETQTITLENSGTFKVPAEWKCYEKNNLMYFVDVDGHPIMIQHHSYATSLSTKYAQPGEKEVNDFFEIQALELLESQVFSNCGIICKTKWLINDSVLNKFEISFSYNTDGIDSPYSFIVLDDSISKEDLEIIVNSYVHFG